STTRDAGVHRTRHRVARGGVSPCRLVEASRGTHRASAPAAMRPKPAPERRRDRRHALTGHACLVRVAGRSAVGRALFGGFVHVGGGGVRLRVRPGTLLAVGDAFQVQLVVTIPTAAPEVTPIRLTGRAVVLRRASPTERAGESEEIALRFDEPL